MNASAPGRAVRIAPRLLLASSSPRRRQLLSAAGYDFDVLPPRDDVEDNAPTSLPPAELVADLAARKATDVVEQLAAAQSIDDVIVVAADTIAECAGEILGKPADLADARRMLRLLSGRAHQVLTGLAVLRRGPKNVAAGKTPVARVEVTTLRMDRLSDMQLQEYLDSGGWRGKAGAFGYQDRLGWVHITQGSESNVVGLPLKLLSEMLREIGYPAPD